MSTATVGRSTKLTVAALERLFTRDTEGATFPHDSVNVQNAGQAATDRELMKTRFCW